MSAARLQHPGVGVVARAARFDLNVQWVVPRWPVLPGQLARRGSPVTLRAMVVPTRRWLQVVELLLAVAVCLLLAASASGFAPAAPEELGGLPTTYGTEAGPDDATSDLPRPGGHGTLHALSLCVAVLVATFVLVSLGTPLLAVGRGDPLPAGRPTRARCSRTLELGLSSQVATKVLLQV